MAITVCPVATASVPTDRVWQVLTAPEHFADWIDGRVVAVVPPGAAQPGQRVDLESPAFGRRWPVRITVEDLDPGRTWIRLRVELPFGVVNEERVALADVEGGRTLVRFD
jgi:hypothetical protein